MAEVADAGEATVAVEDGEQGAPGGRDDEPLLVHDQRPVPVEPVDRVEPQRAQRHEQQLGDGYREEDGLRHGIADRLHVRDRGRGWRVRVRLVHGAP